MRRKFLNDAARAWLSGLLAGLVLCAFALSVMGQEQEQEVDPSIARGRSEPEAKYQLRAAKRLGGKTEVVLFDGTRADIVTMSWAIEVDFADKWAEAVGQSLYYAAVTQKEPGIVLILENRGRDAKYVQRCLVLCHKLNIKLWLMGPDWLSGPGFDQ